MSAACQTEIPPPRPRVLSAPTRRALQIRVDALSAEQRAAAAEIESLYQRCNALTYQVLERQQRLRRFREILLNSGAV